MPENRRILWSSLALGLLALAHAVVTWSLPRAVLLFGGGALLAFVAEAIGVSAGLLDHHLPPTILGVPIYVLFGWTATIYIALRVALLVTAGVPAILLAATLTTSYDLLTDHRGVAQGYWTYTDDLPGPTYRGVPWWNYAAWFGLTALTSGLALFGPEILS